MRLILAACIVLVFGSVGTQSLTGISGRRIACNNEGDPVAVDHIDKQRCFSCKCRNGYVECIHENNCPTIDGCHMLVEKTEDGCCQKCKGCMYKGIHHISHTEWVDPKEPCKIMRCEAGVVTESDIQCHTPCGNPSPPAPGTCCPTCPECIFNGQTVTFDRDVTSDDPCLKCRCSRQTGSLTCSKKACPVLQCAADRQHQPPGECCPKCTGTRTLYTVPKTCTLRSSLFREGNRFTIDKCTHCACKNETSICQRTSCPVLNCSPDLQQNTQGSCCKQCIMPAELKTQCTYRGKVYEDGQSWKLDACSSCKCIQGMPSCAMTRCNVTLPCAPGSQLVRVPGECCERCQESEGVCMAFGDPHYKTFDGKIYSFQGVGKYQLVSDCHGHSFSIRVANVYKNRNTRSSTLTKRVAIKADDLRINLGQNLRTKVNGQRVSLPYKKEGKVRIEKSWENMAVTLQNGVKILWNGKSFLEVTVPATFKNKLCGLCGNFNYNIQDDFKVRKGTVVGDTDVLNFGSSWCVGPKPTCAKQAKQTAKIRPCKMRAAQRKPCKYLTSSELFNGCEGKLNHIRYYKACLMDMCDCPNGKCYCESLMAYAHECERLGVNVQNWQKHSYCTANVKRPHKPNRLSFTQEDIERLLRQRGLNRTRNDRPPILIN